MARRRHDDEGSGALSENFLAPPDSEAVQSSIPQPAKPPVPRIRRSLFPSAIAPSELADAIEQAGPLPVPAAPPSRASRLPPPALPPKMAPLPPMRAAMNSDSGVTLRRERPAAEADRNRTTAALAVEYGGALELEEGNSITNLRPVEAEHLALSRKPSSFAVDEPTALFDRAAAEAKLAMSSSVSVASSKEEESTRLFDRSQLIDPKSLVPESSDFEASTRVVRDERSHLGPSPVPGGTPESVRAPRISPLARPGRYESSPAVISSLGDPRGGVSTGSLSQEAISLQSGDLVPIDQPFSGSVEAPSMRFDLGVESRASGQPFGDERAASRVPVELSLDSCDVIAEPPSLEVPASIRPPPVAAPIAWGRRDRKAPPLVRGAGSITPMPGRLAGRARNLAGPPRPQRFTPVPPAPDEAPEPELHTQQPDADYGSLADHGYDAPSYQPVEPELPATPYEPEQPVAAYAPAPYEPAAYEPAPYAPPPAQVAPSPPSQSYIPQPRHSDDAYAPVAPAPQYTYGSADNAFAHGAPPAVGLPDYDEPAPLSELPDPRGYAGAAVAAAPPDPYAPPGAPGWGAGFVQGHRPESSYREFARPGHGGSSEASFVGGQFIDESLPASPAAKPRPAPLADDSMTGAARNLASPAAERSFVDNAKGAPHFPVPAPDSAAEPPVSSELPGSAPYSGGAYDSGISQQFQSLPLLPTASELLAAAAGRGQALPHGSAPLPPPAPLPVTASQVVPAAAAAPRSRMLLLAYGVVFGGICMVALVQFGTGGGGTAETPPAPKPTVSAPPVAPPAPQYGGAQPGVIGMQPAPPPGYVPQGYPSPEGYPGQAYPAYPGAQPVYATPSEVAPATPETSVKPKPAAPKTATASKPAAPAAPKPPKDDEKPPATSDSKPAKDKSGKASSDLFDNAL